MARFGPKSRYNGRVMAREVSFYQCLWVTVYVKGASPFRCHQTLLSHDFTSKFLTKKLPEKAKNSPKSVGTVLDWSRPKVLSMELAPPN